MGRRLSSRKEAPQGLGGSWAILDLIPPPVAQSVQTSNSLDTRRHPSPVLPPLFLYYKSHTRTHIHEGVLNEGGFPAFFLLFFFSLEGFNPLARFVLSPKTSRSKKRKVGEGGICQSRRCMRFSLRARTTLGTVALSSGRTRSQSSTGSRLHLLMWGTQERP